MPEALLFLNQHEAATLDMLAGHIVPGDADDPGAREAGAVTYVDPLSGYQVMTADTLVARGECCDTGCRHCPWTDPGHPDGHPPSG